MKTHPDRSGRSVAATLVGLMLWTMLPTGCDQSTSMPSEILPARFSVDDSGLVALREDVVRRVPSQLPDLRFEELGSSGGIPEASGIRMGSLVFSQVGTEEGWRRADPASDSDVDPAKSPFDGKYRGSSAHLRLTGSGSVRLPRTEVLAGLSIALQAADVPTLRTLVPGGGFDLPELRILVTGYDSTGASVGTVRAIPAVATYSLARVDTSWIWIDTWMLGPVASVTLEVDSPIPSVTTVLVDNLALASSAPEDPDAFTIALIPDTQKYVENSLVGAEDIFSIQTSWLAGNRDRLRLKFAAHLGDIVENGDRESEWVVADRAMAILDEVVPYGIMVGNHDYEKAWNHPEEGSPGFLRHFPARRFSSSTTWKGVSPDSLSSFHIVPTPIGDFLWLFLSVDSPHPTVPWAESVVAAHPGLPTFVTTHVYLRENGRLPVPYLTSLTDGAWRGISADSLFRGFIAKHPQITMVTCGHVSAESYQASKNIRGDDVHELLQDYQNRVHGGEGFLRLLRFHPSRGFISVLTWSPWLKTFEVDANSQFQIPVAFGSAPWRTP